MPTWSALDVLEGRVPAGALEDKVVLLGVTRLGYDSARTPFGLVPGVEIQAAAADNLPPQAEPGLADGVDPQERARTLVVRTGSEGDFSRYGFALVAGIGATQPPAGCDPVLARIAFSFKVECPSDFDCAEQRPCPPEARTLPPIDYLAKDYPTRRRMMLDRLSTTIFTRMSALATEYGAVNLGQGFPDFDPPADLLDHVRQSASGHTHKYAPMPGLLRLREAIARKAGALYNIDLDPHTEVTITAGATQALFTAIMTLVHPGDEVIIFEPAYDSYRPSVELAGGRTVVYRMQPPDFRINWQMVAGLVTGKSTDDHHKLTPQSYREGTGKGRSGVLVIPRA